MAVNLQLISAYESYTCCYKIKAWNLNDTKGVANFKQENKARKLNESQREENTCRNIQIEAFNTIKTHAEIYK